MINADLIKNNVENPGVRAGSSRKRKMLVADLLCGAGGSSTGCQRALGELGLDMELVCVNHWDTAIATHTLNHPAARHYVQDIATVRPHLLVPEGYLDLLMASPTCFPAGTLVLTEHGPTPIEAVELGTLVLTHKGRWRPVTATMSAMKPTVVVRGHGHFGIETTAEHPFLVCQRKTAWRPHRYVYGEPNWVPAQELVAHAHFWATPTKFDPLTVPPVNDRALAQTPEFWWFVGRWLGDGYFAERHKGRAPSIIVCCAEDEADGLERLLNFARPAGLRAGDNELRWHRAAQSTGVRFETNHAALADWLRTHFGKLAHGKTMPAWVLGMPEINRRALLDGYLSADGWTDNRKREAYTVSRRLAVGVRLLAESLGYRVALHLTKARQNPIEGRQVEQRDQFHLVWVEDRKHQSGGGAAARDVADPVPTMTTAKGGEFGLVMPVTHHDGSDRVRDPAADPLPTVTGANRGELAFIAAQFGEREGQAPRVHDIEQPAPTLCATGRVNLVQGTETYDILFRMLEPHELAAAMGFNDEERRYEFIGTKTEQIKQIGNAVSVAKMRACVAAIMADAAPKTRDETSSFLEAAE